MASIHLFCLVDIFVTSKKPEAIQPNGPLLWEDTQTPARWLHLLFRLGGILYGGQVEDGNLAASMPLS